MTKVSGLGDNCFLHKWDISGDVGSLDTITATRAVQDVTGINKFAHERIFLLRDGEIRFNSFWNASSVAGAEGGEYVLSRLTATDIIVSYFRGTTIGNEAACMQARQIDYNPNRGADGSITAKTQSLADGFGIEWFVQLTDGKVTDSSPTNHTSVDQGASSTNGASAIWHVFTVGSGTVGGQIQDSSDNLSFTAITGMSFMASAVPTSERMQSLQTQTIKRYVRFASTGSFTGAKLAVAFQREPIGATF